MFAFCSKPYTTAFACVTDTVLYNLVLVFHPVINQYFQTTT